MHGAYTQLLLAFAEEPEASSWHYAAWVAIDLRLLIFIVLISALTAIGICAFFVRYRSRIELAAAFLLAFVASFFVLVLIFNQIAHYPVFVIESMFPFP